MVTHAEHTAHSEMSYLHLTHPSTRSLVLGEVGREGGELGPLQVAVHTPYLVGYLNRRPYGSQSKPLLTEPLPVLY